MSEVKTIPWWVWLIPIALLLLATARMPYGFYTILRLVVCAFAAVIAFAEWEENVLGRIMSIAFCSIALLFNPLIPIYLKRGTWFYFDIIVAVLIAVHLVFRRLLGAALPFSGTPH